MTILDKIVAHKRDEVSQQKMHTPIEDLETSPGFNRTCVSMKTHLRRPDKSGIIAEFKRRSPSKGNINTHSSVREVSTGYFKAGASGLSVLTDQQFFGGKSEDLIEARKYNDGPILRKDFIIDEYQLYEAKAIGADVILLIAECLETSHLKALAQKAKALGMEVLMEIHSKEQLAKVNEFVDIVGVNNRNLHDFSVSIQTSIDLYKAIPADFVRISESGISDPNAIVRLKEVGFEGFLIGEYFMANDVPQLACADFIERIQQMEDTLKHGIA